jgi:hypothetical protein
MRIDEESYATGRNLSPGKNLVAQNKTGGAPHEKARRPKWWFSDDQAG